MSVGTDWGDLTYKPVGDTALLVEFTREIDPEISGKVRTLWTAMETEGIDGVEEIVPGYCSLLVYYDSSIVRSDGLRAAIEDVVGRIEELELPPPKVYHLPVRYGGEMGPDLEFVAEENGLTPEEVVEIHTEQKYLIYMIGFSPGFPYLGGMSEEIATPRLSDPRTVTPARSVGIAETETGVYPVESPGGWRLIGRTPVELFTPTEDPPVLLEMGDYVKFYAVSEERYDEIRDAVNRGAYEVEITEVEEVDHGY
jgi:inhibitor of KinA